MRNSIEEKIKRHLGFKNIKFLNEGFRSKAYLLDKEYILLLGVNKKAFKSYKSDQAISEFLSKKIDTVLIPKDIRLIEPSEDLFEFGGELYQCIKGKIFNIDKKDNYNLTKIAKDLANFLNELHNINVYDFNPTFSPERYKQEEKKLLARNIMLLKKILPSSDINKLKKWRDKYFEILENTENFSVIHGDFWYENYIISEDNQNLVGIIDFENTTIADPMTDLAPILYIGKKFLTQLLKDYQLPYKNIYEKIKVLSERREIVSFQHIYKYCDKEEIDEQIKKIYKLKIF